MSQSGKAATAFICLNKIQSYGSLQLQEQTEYSIHVIFNLTDGCESWKSTRNIDSHLRSPIKLSEKLELRKTGILKNKRISSQFSKT